MQSGQGVTEFDLIEAKRVLAEVFAPWVRDLGLSVESIEMSPPPGAPADWQSNFVSAYAADESQRAGLGIRFVSVLPQLTPATELGAAAVAAYAQRAGQDLASYTENMGPALTPEQVGKAIIGLIEAPAPAEGPEAYLLTAGGLRPVP